jgi:Type I phosphodiesterase / nucleotide pyrophosphatase
MNLPPDPRVDELRQQLRSLGYLDAGVDRFLLGSARQAGRPLSLAAFASLRVGLLGGLLLGPAAALGVGARLPGLISGVRDALVIAIYLALLFFVAVAAASFALSAIGVVAIRARAGSARLERLSRVSGFVLTLATLAYLTLWWRNANAGFGWSAPVWTSFALLVAVAISLLLGHAQRITTLAVLAAAAGPGVSLPAVTNRSWRGILAGGALAFAGAAMLLVVTTSADSSLPAAAPNLTVVSHDLTVKVIAVDGIDSTLVDVREWAPPLAPGLRFAVEYDSTADPARTWTTIATGTPPEVHGIHAIEGRRVAGLRGVLNPDTSATGRVLQRATDLIRLSRPSIASRNERKVMTFWEVAEAAGLRSAVVNWWATWPAGARKGIVVSDRAVLRLEHGGTLDAEISPPRVYEDLLKRWSEISRSAESVAQSRFGTMADREAAAVLVRSATLDGIVIAIDQALTETQRDLDVIYLPGLDIAQHALLAEQTAAPSTLSARLAALRSYHAFLRDLIRPSLKPMEHHVTMVITAPGRLGSNVAGHVMMIEPYVPVPPPPHPRELPTNIETRDPGPQGISDVADRTARAIDIAPTILNLLGVPISRELPGTALPEWFAPAPDRYVATYGRPRAEGAPRAGKPLDQEMIDRLRSLGYVK